MLYVCATPIGNLADVTLRVLDALRSVDVICCEDTRHTAILLRRHGIEARALLSLHEHNEEARVARVLELIEGGAAVALVSDAGLPGLSDPGFVLVRACIAAGVEVSVLPGASAVTTALVASGLPTDRFIFVGFVPRGAAKTVAFLEAAGSAGGSVVAFESPHRLRATLAAVAERWPERWLAVCRELTKVHEEVLRGTASSVLESLAERVRGEVVLVLAPEEGGRWSGGAGAVDDARGLSGAGGPSRTAVDARVAAEVLETLLGAGMRTRDASDVVARLTGADRRAVYDLAQAVKRQMRDSS